MTTHVVTNPVTGGDLNNTSAARQTVHIATDPQYFGRSLAIHQEEDDPTIRNTYRPFLLSDAVATTDWISQLELSTALKLSDQDLVQNQGNRIKVLVLYGSLRARSYSRLVSFEASRILHRLGCDVRVYDPTGLPVKDDVSHDHPKVQELRSLSRWSDGHVWISPEQHGQVTAVFKNQIDWIPLSTGSVRPTQNRTLAIAQVSGGSQSFNTVNTLRILGRWMRMWCIPNQSSIPMAYTQFSDAEPVATEQKSTTGGETSGDEHAAPVTSDGGSRMLPSGNRDRLVDCMEEFVRFTILMRPVFDAFGDRYSEREERRKNAAKAEKDG